MKRFVLILAVLSVVFKVSAQVNDFKGIIYNHELSGGALIHTSGWGLFMDLAHRDELKKKTMWEFELSQIHHPKEVKQTIDFGLAFFGFNSPKPFVYGKQNNFYQVSASYGKQFMIAEGAEKSGVEVGLKVLGGFSLGLLKPYYLNVLYPTDNTNNYEIRAIRYSPETADKFLDWFSIYGGAGFIYGFDEIKFVPGIHLKTGLNFDWAQNEEAIKGLEVGATLDAYYKEVPIMILEHNAQFYPNLYLSLQFGKKW
jgi:hypothetical protein